jgi:hypothetical protein
MINSPFTVHRSAFNSPFAPFAPFVVKRISFQIRFKKGSGVISPPPAAARLSPANSIPPPRAPTRKAKQPHAAPLPNVNSAFAAPQPNAIKPAAPQCSFPRTAPPENPKIFQLTNPSPPNPLPPPPNFRCAKMLSKAHHRASLTEGDNARRTIDHRTDPARSPTTARRQKRQGNPHTLLQNATPCYKISRSFWAPPQLTPSPNLAPLSVLRALAVRLPPRAPRRTIHAKCAERTHVPSCHTRHSAPNCANAPHARARCKTNPLLLASRYSLLASPTLNQTHPPKTSAPGTPPAPSGY